jgi:hypothetical protein
MNISSYKILEIKSTYALVMKTLLDMPNKDGKENCHLTNQRQHGDFSD